MTYDEWTGSPEGAMCLTIGSHCDTFAQANKILRAAFEAGHSQGTKSDSATEHHCIWRTQYEELAAEIEKAVHKPNSAEET